MPRLALLAVFAVCLRAQTAEEFQQLLDRLRSAPVELQVNGLLRLVETGRTKGRLDEIKLIEECFHLAAQAARQQPLDLIGGGITEDPDYLLARATTQRLGRLSLQSWAITLMSARQPRKARELLALTPLPAYHPLDCSARRIDAPQPYYDALGALLKSGFTRQERTDGALAAAVQAELAKLSSPTQLSALLHQLNRLEWTRDEFAALVPALGAALTNIHVDDRTFSATARNLYGLIPKLEQFGLKARALGVAPDPIALAIRQYLAAHLSAERCADTAANDPPPPEGVRMLPKPPHPAFADESLPEVANYFNYKLRLAEHFTSADLPALEKEQITPSKLAGIMARAKIFWSNESEITLKAKGLYWGGRSDNPLTLEERSTPEWDRQAQEYRRLVSDYRRVDGQPAESWFLHKSGLMMALWGLMPDGPQRNEVLADVVRFLASVDKREVGLDLWVLGVKDVMNRARRGRQDRTVAPEVLAAMVQAGDPALWLVAEMDAWK